MSVSIASWVSLAAFHQETKDIVHTVSVMETLSSSLINVKKDDDSHRSECFEMLSRKVGIMPPIDAVVNITRQTPCF